MESTNDAITSSQFSDARALAKAVPYGEFTVKVNQTKLINEEHESKEKLLQKELDSAKAALEAMKKSKQTRSQLDKVTAENKVLTAKFALLENTTHYQTQQIKHLKKAIEAMQEREQDFHLLSIGNMVTELFKRNGLVDAYRATFNIQNTTIVTPGFILYQLEAEASNVNEPSTVTEFFVNFLQVHLPNLTLNDIYLMSVKFSRIQNAITHTVLKVDVVQSIGKFNGAFREVAEKVFREYFGETYDTAWEQLFPITVSGVLIVTI